MNEETPEPFDTVGDGPVEARIVAWVLGEASAFEEAELERLCQERPELEVFRRRMQSLHGLLSEAETASPDLSWKLPAEKRQALDLLVGMAEENGKVVALDREQRIARSGRRAFLAMAACVVVSFFITVFYYGKLIKMDRAGFQAAAEGDSKAASGREGSAGNVSFRRTEISDAEIRDQEAKVEERRKALVETVRNRGITYTGEDSFSDKSADDQGSDERLKTVERLKKETREGAIKRGLDAQDYVDAKRDFEKDYALLLEMKMKRAEADSRAKSSLSASRREELSRFAKAPASPAITADMKAKETGADFISPVNGTSVDGLPAESDQFAANGVTNGLRSGDQAIQRNNIDAILNNPNRTASLETPQQALSESELAGGPSNPGMRGAGGRGLPAEPSAPAKRVADQRGQGLGSGTALSGELAENSMKAAGGEFKSQVASQPQVAADAAEDSFADSLESKNKESRGITAGARSLSDRDGNPAVAAKPKPVGRERMSGTALPSLSQSAPASAPAAAAAVPPAGEAVAGISGAGEISEQPQVLSDLAKTEQTRRQSQVELADAGKKQGMQESDAALREKHAQNVDSVRRGLYTAEGNFNLGKFEDAKREYENVLRVDPNNSAARRGMERVASAKSDYYRAAYDHTRAELLAEVDKAWELATPPDEAIGKDSKPADTNMPLAKDADVPDLATWAGAEIKAARQLGLTADQTVWGTSFAYSGKVHDDEALSLYGEAGSEESSPELYSYNFRTLDEAVKGDVSLPEKASQPTLTDLIGETLAKDDPYSTFSLNISDASFRVAKAALDRGDRPAPDGIKPEQFYNAVDYGDPGPASGEPVAATIEQSAHPVLPGRNLVRVAVRTASTGRAETQPLQLTLLVDQSGSMVRDDRRSAMDQSLHQLAGLLTAKDKVTVIGFSRVPRLLADGMAGDQAGKLSEIVNQTASEGGTNLEEAMKLGTQLAERHRIDGAQNRVVLFTDGAANLGNADPVRLAEQVKALRQKGIAFDVAGIAADELNDQLLGELARHGNGRYYVVGERDSGTFAKQLAGAFRPAAENVKVQVNFNPDRVARYKLIGFEKDRLKTEDFRNDAVDAAELAADEAGIAIYQVEPLPEGKGELGELSVRFRNAETGEMVERTWTLAYDASASPFDRATPSMQLAGLSMLAAHKLQGGPLADAIDFKQFAAPAASVKSFIGGNPGVSDMLQVIEALK